MDYAISELCGSPPEPPPDPQQTADDTEVVHVKNGVIVFPEQVEAAINEVLPSNDPLDRPDLNVVDYINTLFPTEQSLTGLEDKISELNYRVENIELETRDMVRSQVTVGGDAAAALKEAQEAISQLFSQIRDIKDKAGESEKMVKDITRDIKQLDTAKRNLTTAITTLNHLHMLVGGTATLATLTSKRQYGEAALLLQGLLEVLNHFSSYQNIPQIKELSEQVESLKKELGEQIRQDFMMAMSGDNTKNVGSSKQLAEACLVVSVLDSSVKRSLISWFIQLQIKEYTIMFQDNEEQAWLDKVDRRFNWFKKSLIEFEERHGAIFPPDWEMSERIGAEFCRVTRTDLARILQRRSKEVDTKLLLHSIQKTTAFESLLSRRFTGKTLNLSTNYDPSINPFEDSSAVTSQNYHNINSQPFKGIISSCFEQYLYIYIEAQDRNLTELIDRFVEDVKKQPLPDAKSETGTSVLSSCGDLFVFYKKCLVQCAELSTGQSLLSLANLFKKYLRQYMHRVILANLPKIGGRAANSIQFPVVSQLKDLKDISQATSGLLQNFSSLLKEGETVRFSEQDQVLICTFLVTAEYCLDTSQQLQEKLKQKVDPEFTEEINLSGELDMFHSAISNCLSLLVQELDIACDAPLVSMTKINWSQIQQVGDQSVYVSQLLSVWRGMVPRVRDCLTASRKYFTQFCVKFVCDFITKFISMLYKCKPLSTVGAEQLLLDTHSIKTVLMDLPNICETAAIKPSRKAPAVFTKVVIKGMTRAEMILKVVMSHADPPSVFIEQYIRLIQDPDTVELGKLLDMKGLRRNDHALYLQLFREAEVQEKCEDSMETTVPGSPSTQALAEQTRVKKLEKLIKKRM